MSALHITDPDDRGDLGTFVGRVVRLDQTAAVRLLGSASGRVTAWASTPFDVLATRSVPGTVEPADVTTFAAALLSALSVDRADTVDPGSGGLWQGLLPPDDGWAVVDTVPAAELEGLTERGLALAREHAGPLGPPASLLDQTVLTVAGCGRPARPDPDAVPLRAVRHGFRRGGRRRRDGAGLGDDVVVAPGRPLRRGGAAPDHRAAAADLTAVCRTCRLAAAKVPTRGSAGQAREVATTTPTTLSSWAYAELRPLLG